MITISPRPKKKRNSKHNTTQDKTKKGIYGQIHVSVYYFISYIGVGGYERGWGITPDVTHKDL
jgi:hypothetical protein